MDTSKRNSRALLPSFFLYWKGELFANPWLKLDFTFPIYANYNHDQIFNEYAKRWDFSIVPEFELTILPAQFNKKAKADSEKEGSSAKLFARVRYYDMPNVRGNNFMQLQTGVSFSISDLMK